MIRVAILTISDSTAAGARADLSGPALAEKVQALGWAIVDTTVVADEPDDIGHALNRGEGVDVILTTGGTGIAPRDRTPEATRAIAEREIPGLGELMRQKGLEKTRFSPLSRSGGYTLREMLILNLPGSPKGAVESFEAVASLIPHIVDLLHGRTEHHAKPSPPG
jgi:molybdopterin adenylyltransferase